MPLTASQIVTAAAGIAKAPGYTSQAGLYLNLVLQDLVLHRDLQVNRYTTTLTLTANSNGPFSLPADFLRVYDLFYYIPTSQNQNQGMPILLHPASLEDYDAMFKDPSVSSYPTSYAIDTEPTSTSGGFPQLYVYPQSNVGITLTLRYMIKRAEIATPASSSTVPWFNDQDYLIHATAARLMKLTDDARYSTFVQDAENMLRTELIMEGTEQKVVKSVRLDPNRFRNTRWLKPTKSYPY